ncbi:hypothetical protein IP88_15530 [alpha proteobacterium AAP81b]|nr:hypothetical protein IP88_15530 [alpha proteobacterium AAP81b]
MSDGPLPGAEVAPPEADSIGELLRRLLEDVVHLVRTELRLARAEVGAGAAAAAGGAGMIVGGIVFVSAALICLTVALVAWLSTWLGVPGAALAVAAGTAVLGMVLILLGVNAVKKIDLAPRRTVANVKRDVQALKGE